MKWNIPRLMFVGYCRTGDNTGHMSLGAITKRPAALLALGLCSVGVVVSLLGRLATGPLQEPKRIEFTNEPGAHAYPAFSRDGKQVAYSAHGVLKDDAFHIFVRPSSGGAPRQLTTGEASDVGPVWKRDGSSLAFLRVNEDAILVMVIPAAGGEPRKVAQFAAATDEVQPEPAVAWMGDGKSLVVAGAAEDQPSAVSVVDVETGTMRRITNPAKDTVGDSAPSVAPDGATIAFMRSTANVQALHRDRDRENTPEYSGAPRNAGPEYFQRRRRRCLPVRRLGRQPPPADI